MKKAGLLFLILCLGFFLVKAQRQAKPVFTAGEDGYESYRIPAIITAPNGDLLAFSEGRVNGAADFGHVNIVMKRSKDLGQTWSELQVVATNGNLQAGNPAPVVDQTDPDYPKGRIFLFYNTGDQPEGKMREGIGTREVWYKTSVDGGASWSEAVNITNETKAEEWRSYANTPGHATQFTEGKYKGRIFVPANHSAGEPQPAFKDYRAHGFYSDDHGKTFHLSENVCFPGGNESTATPLEDGVLMMNSRNQAGAPRTRIVALSKDGGETWDKIYYDHQLPDPVNQGAILKIGEKKGKSILAFSNAATPDQRINLTLKISKDAGKTWTKNILVDEEGVSTAYSDIVKIDKKRIGVLYERNGYSEIVFKTIKW